ncbi:MAG TPA: response regulator transcription factor [Pyrinomonadaceae bacterium]|nr:response regulator transcription factor [Pyrinomonadaceae bacterium]
MAHILVIEDERNVAIALRDTLESDGHTVSVAPDGSAGFVLASSGQERFDLILLDLMLPKMSGLEICQRLRSREIETPVIMLTARGASSDAAFGLKLGADDYIPKPFDVGELLARIEAVLRRANRQHDETVRIGDVHLDLRRLKATRNGEPVDVSPRGFEILQFLIAHKGETVTREQLLHHIWGEHASLYTRTIDAHITRLRQKIEPDPANPVYIITAHRVGYRLIQN